MRRCSGRDSPAVKWQSRARGLIPPYGDLGSASRRGSAWGYRASRLWGARFSAWRRALALLAAERLCFAVRRTRAPHGLRYTPDQEARDWPAGARHDSEPPHRRRGSMKLRYKRTRSALLPRYSTMDSGDRYWRDVLT